MKNFRPSSILVAGLLLACGAKALVAQTAVAAPKYGEFAVPLHDAHSYFRRHDATDFWALIPFHTAQPDERSCSVASIAMIVNAVRSKSLLSREDRLIDCQRLLKLVDDRAWSAAVGPGGEGVSLDEVARLAALSLRRYGVSAKVQARHIDTGDRATVANFRAALVANEETADDFIVANFLQGTLTGDPAGNVGHIAPLAAFDAKRDRVLILDPDRDWYEPYWVSVERLVAAMATQDLAARQARGYLTIDCQPAAR